MKPSVGSGSLRVDRAGITTVPRRHIGANGVGVMALVCDQHCRLGQIVVHDSIVAAIVGGLPGCHVELHGQAVAVDEKMGLGREDTP